MPGSVIPAACVAITAPHRYHQAMDDHALLSLAIRLAEQAGAAILAVRARGFAVERKLDQSPVTEADHAAEAIIVDGLRAATPALPVIAEEEVAAGCITAPVAAFWLVDPLDGTREFAAGKDEFVVNIGLVRDGRMALGVVFIPALGEMFTGIVGVGAWKRDRSGEAAIHTRAPPEDGLTVVASRLHGDSERLDAFLAGRSVSHTLNYGSALKFCRLAEGVADLYPRFGRTMEWDTAAPQAGLEAAGGRVLTIDGVPLRYGKPGWENPHFICWGR
jgi:3'(2'), 5'-bisphosphate nucleotidase